MEAREQERVGRGGGEHSIKYKVSTHMEALPELPKERKGVVNGCELRVVSSSRHYDSSL